MQVKKDELYYFFILTAISAISFLAGLTLIYALHFDSGIFIGLQTALTERITSQILSVDLLFLSAIQELKYFAFILIFLFSNHRKKYIIALSSVKGAAFGICSALIMRAVKYEYINANYSFISCFVYVLLITSLVVLLCYSGAKALCFSERLFYPLRIQSVIKRKDTRLFLLDYLAICGGAVIISALITTNFYLMLF